MRKACLISFVLSLLLISHAALAQVQTAVFTANLRGGSENPPVRTEAVGAAFVILGSDNRLTYTVTCKGFGAAPNAVSAAHIHVGGPKDNGSVRYPLVVDAGGNGSGTINLTAPEAAAFMRTEFYVNLHTAQNPAGAIRGQLRLHASPSLMWESFLTGVKEVPANDSRATGKAFFLYDPQERLLAYTIQATGFGPAPNAVTAGHIHRGNAKTNGEASIPLKVNQEGNGAEILALTDVQRGALLNSETYVNLHTAQYSAGAIRGQLEANPGPSRQFAIRRNPTTGTMEVALDYGESITSKQAYRGGKLVDLVFEALSAGKPEISVTPAYDPNQYPRGPMRALVLTKSASILAGTEFLVNPGILAAPEGLRGGISLPNFRNVYFQDYEVTINSISVNNLGMTPFLFGPVTVSSAQFGDSDREAVSVSATAYNVSFRIETPGEYLVGYRWKSSSSLRRALPGGDDLVAGEYIVMMPILVTGHRPIPPYSQADGAAGARTLLESQKILQEAIREAIEEYEFPVVSPKSRRQQ